jgi:hypothetical protein
MSTFCFSKPVMSRALVSLILAGLLVLTACNSVESNTAVPQATSTLIACNERTVIPTPGSILPAFTTSYACELENASEQVNFCMNHTSPELSYPCSQFESVQEIAIGEGEQTLLIQRDYYLSRGCWTAVTTETRSLRTCDKVSGYDTILATNIYGELVPSPDEKWYAFAATELEKFFEPHVFQVRADGTEMMQLDVRPFPHEQVPGAQILKWSEDGEWLEVSLWDGHENGYHRYRIRTDGSGEFEALP